MPKSGKNKRNEIRIVDLRDDMFNAIVELAKKNRRSNGGQVEIFVEQALAMQELLTSLKYAKEALDRFQSKYPEQARDVLYTDEMIQIEKALKKVVI